MAYRLVYANYVQRGYIEPRPSGLWVTLFNALPEALTLVGVVRGEVVATVTVFPDSPLLLPMDEIYHAELMILRTAGRVLAEVGMLADRRQQVHRTLPAVLALMKLVFHYAMSILKADDLCIAINPRHDQFYRRFLPFEELAGERSYPRMRDNPALARRLCLAGARETCAGNPFLLEHFFGNPPNTATFLNRYRPTPADWRYFLVERTDVWQQATPEARRRLLESVPGLAMLGKE